MNRRKRSYVPESTIQASSRATEAIFQAAHSTMSLGEMPEMPNSKNTQSCQKSISHWEKLKKLGIMLSLASSLSGFANHSVQLWQNVELNNYLPSVEEVKSESSNTD